MEISNELKEKIREAIELANQKDLITPYSEFIKTAEAKEYALSNEEVQNILKRIINDIPMYKIYSTNLVAIGYNKDLQILRVIFKGDSSYLYFNVEPEIWDLLNTCESKGKTLNEAVIRQKEKYKFMKITAAKED